MIKPINDGILIRRSKPEELSPSGKIIISKVPSGRRQTGKVLAVGQGHRLQNGGFTPLSIKAGDTVVFNYANGNDIEVDGENLNMCRESDIVGVVEDKYQPPQAYREVPENDPEGRKLWEEKATTVVRLEDGFILAKYIDDDKEVFCGSSMKWVDEFDNIHDFFSSKDEALEAGLAS